VGLWNLEDNDADVLHRRVGRLDQRCRDLLDGGTLLFLAAGFLLALYA